MVVETAFRTEIEPCKIQAISAISGNIHKSLANSATKDRLGAMLFSILKIMSYIFKQQVQDTKDPPNIQLQSP